MNRSGRVLGRIRAVGLIVGGLTLLFVAVVALDVYRYAQRDDARPADAAIVLGAGVFGQRPSPVLRERIEHALLLYEQGYVRRIIFTGGRSAPGELAEAEVAATYARARGVSAAAILTETTSTSTRENLANAHAVAAAEELHTFLLVSTPYHMRRAIAVAQDLGMEAYSSPTRTIHWLTPFTQARAYGREVGRYLLYLVRGW